MLLPLGETKTVLRLLVLASTLSGAASWSTPYHEAAPQVAPQATPPQTLPSMLMIRVSQESRPGAADFDQNILGFARALQTNEGAHDFYQYGKNGPNYGNTKPLLTANTSHIFFVNAMDGLALFVVHNNTNHAENGHGGSANTRWDLSGGIAKVLKSDDAGEAWQSEGGTVFHGEMSWAQANTDGMVVGALPVGFTILGQFTEPPKGLVGGWEIISDDGSKIPLSLVVGQRVRLDVALHVKVRQNH